MKMLCHIRTQKKSYIFLTGFTVQHFFTYNPNG